MSDEEIDRLVTGLAMAMALPLDPAHREGVCTNFRRFLDQADIVMSIAIPPETEPAPIFRP